MQFYIFTNTGKRNVNEGFFKSIVYEYIRTN